MPVTGRNSKSASNPGANGAVPAVQRGHYERRRAAVRLRAEMRAPGRAWLELAVEPDGNGSLYRQRAIFFPKGLSGKLYWLAVLPFHSLIFPAMSRNITAAAQKLAEADAGSENLPAAP